MTEKKNFAGVKPKVTVDLENSGRRKAVKTIVSGVVAVAAFHTMPTNWSKPLIEQVFLPAHAQTSAVEPVQPSEPVLSCLWSDYDYVNNGILITVTATADNVDVGGAMLDYTFTVTGVGPAGENYGPYIETGTLPLGMDGIFTSLAQPLSFSPSNDGTWEVSLTFAFQDQLQFGTHSTSCTKDFVFPEEGGGGVY